MTVGTPHLAFGNFCDQDFGLVPMKLLRNVELFVGQMVKVQDYGICFTAINAGMCSEIV
jgi:hypothetical protein